jgi:hypothetical protein
MDQEIRNKLRSVVTQCRKLLEEAIAQELEGKYGIFAKKDQVMADPNAKMTHLSEEEQAARKDILDHYAHIEARGFKPKDALDQLIREIAFTHLNRLCAYKMMEARDVYVGGQKFREAVSRGVNSNGVKFYLAEHPEEERLFNTGQQDVAYQHFLDWLGGALSDEIGVLFNPNDPANRLYPRQKTLDEVLDLLNGGGIKAEETELRDQWPQIWSQDETIGWVYQYFTPKELRDQARKESQAPRNSYELAFRNQFFTPRYVVEFLTDNTLGCIWYEMRKGDTKLKDQCRYMVRRPTEIFLKDGEQPAKDAAEGKDDLSQEELLKLPVHIPHRPKKDPRELKILDPACGSGHFLLYCFDLLLTIYEEAYADPDLGPALKKDYPTLDALKRDVPRLILARNLHGIDIDLRASQIAALALWLRCQRAYQEMGFKKDRPQITRSNFVCAEPMPGEEQMLKEFVSQLEPKVLGQVVEVVFDKMKLAGEAGSLLKIEEEIRDAVATAKKQFVRETTQATDRKGQPLLFTQAAMDRLAGKPEQPSLFDLSDITDNQFFEQAESRVIDTLRAYAEKAQNGQRLQRRLFSDDAVRGFAFVDLCQKRYDVVLMNPPFGLPCSGTYNMLVAAYPYSYADLASAFLSLATRLLSKGGLLGSITTRSYLQSSDLGQFRQKIVLPAITILLDLGPGVMDEAWVEASAQVIGNNSIPNRFLVIDRRQCDEPQKRSHLSILATPTHRDRVYFPLRTDFDMVPKLRVTYDASDSLSKLITSASRMKPERAIATTGLRTFDDERFYRLRWEVVTSSIGPALTWCDIAKNTDFGCWYIPYHTVVKWCGDGRELARKNIEVNGQTAQARQGSKHYFKSGLCFSRRSEPTFSVRVHPSSAAFSSNGGIVIPKPHVSIYYLAGVLNSSAFRAAVKLLANKYSYTSGHVEVLAWQEPDNESEALVIKEARDAILAKIEIERMSETDPFYSSLPQLCDSRSLTEYSVQQTLRLQTLTKRIIASGRIIDGIVAQLYGLQVSEDELATKYRSSVHDLARSELGNGVGSDEIAAAVVSFTLGCAFGRWDIRYAINGVAAVPQVDPIGPLPASAPGVLQDEDGFPLPSVPSDYPIHIECNGIIADNPGHPNDVARRVRDVVEVIWKSQADDIEKEACEILGVKSLRDYFRKTGKGGFWDDHISRYSKSRRKAPIYWLLQSSKKNYALWLYYHRLDKDLLFKALVNYVEPKIRLETSRFESIRTQKVAAGDSGKEAKRHAKDVERQEDFLSELRDFEDKLRRAANLNLEPDLNDGVVLNIAPLHELVPWKEAKKYWDELMDGKYEWSSIGKQLRQKGLVK